MHDQLALTTQGTLWVHHLFPGGEERPAAMCHNALQNLGCGAAARCLATPGLSLNRMYLLFAAGRVGSPAQVPGVAAGTATLAAVQRADASYNYCRVPVIHVATGGEAGYGDNIVTFHGVTEGVATGSGVAFTTGSKLYGAALACAVSENPLDDLLFSVATLDNVVAKVANAQLGIRWQVRVIKV